MMRAALVLLPLAFAAGFAGMRLTMDGDEPAAIATAPAAPKAATVADAAPPAPRIEMARVRNVTPEGFTFGPDITGPLKRVTVEPPPVAAPAQAPGADGATPAATAEPRGDEAEAVLHRPVFAAIDVIESGSRQIRLAGIEAPAAEATCGEDSWPCGRMALAAVQRFVRGRSVTCPEPSAADGPPEQSRCRVGDEEIGAWLVGLGWARAADDTYRQEEAEARAMRIGLWSPTRPGAAPTATQADPLAELLAGMAGAPDLQAAPASSPESALEISARVSGTP